MGPTTSRSGARSGGRGRGRSHPGVDALFAAVFVGLGVVLPLVRGEPSAPLVLVTAAAGLVVGGAVAFAPPRWRAPAWLLLLFVGAAVGAALELPSSWYAVWLFDYLLGCVVGLSLVERLPRRSGDR